MRKTTISLATIGLLGLLTPFYLDLTGIYVSVRSSVGVGVEKKSRILCWIQTWPANHMKRAIHVKQTWGSRCDILLFMSSQQDDRLGTVVLPGIEDGHNKLWPKTRKAFNYIWEHYQDDAEWFFRADDDAYVFTDNLRTFLKKYDPKQPHYLGCRVDYGNNVIVNLGFSFAVSKEALRMFIEESLPFPEKCYPWIRAKYKGDDDTEFGVCLHSVGIRPGNTTDANGRSLFSVADPVNDMKNVYKNYEKWKKMGKYRAEQMIAFQVKPEHMYVLEYLTYYLNNGRSFNYGQML